MTWPIPAAAQVVLDFDGVLCDSAAECLWICWCALQGAPVEAFLEPDGTYAVPADIAAQYWSNRPYMRHLGQFVVPLLPGPAPTDRAGFAERFASLDPAFVERFTVAAREYRAAVSDRYRDGWLALHGVWAQVAELVAGAYIATARDSASVIEILGAHGVDADADRIHDELTEKVTALESIAARESLDPAAVWLLDDSIDNCVAVHRAGFGAAWVSWGCGARGDRAIAERHGIAVIELGDIPESSNASAALRGVSA